MAQSQYSLSWNSYKSNICNGFSSLQQNGEFVDMTIAADGHMVKVHQVLVALASPYLKDLIASAPSQHPIIFLNNVSHKVMSYLLEYIYTGEVVIPSDCLQNFVDTARSLHIKGLETICDSVNVDHDNTFGNDTEMTPTKVPGLKRKATTSLNSIESGIMLPLSARKIFVKSEDTLLTPKNEDQPRTTTHTHKTPDMPLGTAQEFPELEDGGTHDQDSDDGFKFNEITSDTDTEKLKSVTSNLLFTVSIRGSLQVILNRYIYNLNTTTSKAGLRKWRCVDYRDNKCNAFLVTKGNVVVNRANPHNHPFHDKKILSKIEKKSVFSAFNDVEAYREKEREMDRQAKTDPSTLDVLENLNKTTDKNITKLNN